MPFKLYYGWLVAWISIFGPAAADPVMTIDFSWQGTTGCVTLFPNPEIRIHNVPADAKLLLLTLTQGAREMGGEEVLMPANGIVPAGSIRTFGPCRPDVYRWTAVAKSATGRFLAEARQARFYPTDELAPEKP
ncbi:hypothetical protein [Bradyrhizobium sp. CCGUVB23]|uniref:hypothetical protein n=1 Tax=Bradyrhizobium sp. CCGUVB23 TaxID=2949630 RepID=UPI0020B3ED72|nr:hypothetical protein [Bradyrhizobium sp. CCGUVB23]MCP3460054.1 hypothetical protein [Bradyrhizobium sp. CCGUVB23]